MISFLRSLPYSVRRHLWLLRLDSDENAVATEGDPDPEIKTNGGNGSSGDG
jgi:hypothetical protein